MSSSSPVPVARTPVPVPRTAVALGIADPVEQARAELKAALAAIEEKANVPRRVAEVTDRTVAQARAFTRRNPTGATAAVVAGAAVVGLIVWAAVRAYTR
ncbi:hypothetical protein NQ152_05635 [Microbacterium sp. zg.B48]|uniref:hypothetical protein n=1 Tax=unclassified Microbacterium TaxID=2609290 RepID=UPI00214CCA41|nr:MULTISPECIES: hypothetical protein [unclassified Microbacterium]MCR2762988.1 hypothetical protein [Microbacterium sp. zg.B48]MCR2808574.1 hypothetical protein [Microbacterium sp. zg.B185]WIM18988.1 hypothetical protein QNO12_15615 [Microbacterium sp. zg-B185]